jgi:ubiquinone/menaquinone biosynthesis C-methylase UbiE
VNLLDVVFRQAVPAPWSEGDKIPWDDLAFSERMLREHLCQRHDLASRRLDIIDLHVSWIHQHILAGTPSRVLDLCCGPGLYTSRLAKLGHRCVGIDFSPASIAYADEQAQRETLLCTYIQGDIRYAEYGSGYDLVMLIFGELNVFRAKDVQDILRKAQLALVKGGTILLEPHTFEGVRRTGEKPPSWYTSRLGLFSGQPHLCLRENFWDADHRAATERLMVVDATTAELTWYASSMQAYTEEEYKLVLQQSGFGDITFRPSLGGEGDTFQSELMVISARKL